MNNDITMVKQEDGSYKVDFAQGQEVELEQRAGILEGFAKTEVFGLPLGAAAGGLLTVGIWDAIRGLLSGIIPQLPQWAVPAVGAWAVSTKTVKGWVGATAANTAGIILIADAIQGLFNVRGLVSGLVGGVKLGQTRSNLTGEPNSIDEYLKRKGLV